MENFSFRVKHFTLGSIAVTETSVFNRNDTKFTDNSKCIWSPLEFAQEPKKDHDPIKIIILLKPGVIANLQNIMTTFCDTRLLTVQDTDLFQFPTLSRTFTTHFMELPQTINLFLCKPHETHRHVYRDGSVNSSAHKMQTAFMAMSMSPNRPLTRSQTRLSTNALHTTTTLQPLIANPDPEPILTRTTNVSPDESQQTSDSDHRHTIPATVETTTNHPVDIQITTSVEAPSQLNDIEMFGRNHTYDNDRVTCSDHMITCPTLSNNVGPPPDPIADLFAYLNGNPLLSVLELTTFGYLHFFERLFDHVCPQPNAATIAQGCIFCNIVLHVLTVLQSQANESTTMLDGLYLLLQELPETLGNIFECVLDPDGFHPHRRTFFKHFYMLKHDVTNLYRTVSQPVGRPNHPTIAITSPTLDQEDPSRTTYAAVVSSLPKKRPPRSPSTVLPLRQPTVITPSSPPKSAPTAISLPRASQISAPINVDDHCTTSTQPLISQANTTTAPQVSQLITNHLETFLQRLTSPHVTFASPVDAQPPNNHRLPEPPTIALQSVLTSHNNSSDDPNDPSLSSSSSSSSSSTSSSSNIHSRRTSKKRKDKS